MDVNARKRWSVALVSAVVVWFLMGTDPLGIEEATADRSARFMFRVAAPFYSGSGHVVVVLIDQEFLSGTQWPATYKQQGKLLRRIMDFNPSAVFLDLLYSAPHHSGVDNSATSDSDVPEKLLNGISEDLYPRIYVAALPHEGTCDRKEREGKSGARILNNSGMVDEIVGKLPEWNVVAVGWSGCGDSYPLLLSDDAQARTPAYALYRKYCEDKNAAPSIRKRCANKASDDDFQTPMTIRWGAFAPEAQKHFYSEKSGQCYHYAGEEGRVPLYRRIWVAVQQFSIAMVNGLDAVKSNEYKLPCLAITVLSAAEFSSPEFTPHDKALEGVIKDNLVLIGARVPGVPDVDVSPVHGLIAGVELHAMALDNLLTLHDRYARATFGEWLQRGLDLVVLLMAAGLTVVFSSGSPREKKWVDMVPSFLGLAFWIIYVAFWCWHGDWALAIFGLLGCICLDYFHPRETWEAVQRFALVCCFALLTLWIGTPTRNIIVVALTAIVMSAAIKAKLNDQPSHDEPSNSLLKKYLLRRLHSDAKHNSTSPSERSSP